MHNSVIILFCVFYFFNVKILLLLYTSADLWCIITSTSLRKTNFFLEKNKCGFYSGIFGRKWGRAQFRACALSWQRPVSVVTRESQLCVCACVFVVQRRGEVRFICIPSYYISSFAAQLPGHKLTPTGTIEVSQHKERRTEKHNYLMTKVRFHLESLIPAQLTLA